MPYACFADSAHLAHACWYALHTVRVVYRLCSLYSTISIYVQCTTDIEFDSESGGYYPILFLNDYWNLAQDYMPINDTTKWVRQLHGERLCLCSFKFILFFPSGALRSPWSISPSLCLSSISMLQCQRRIPGLRWWEGQTPLMKTKIPSRWMHDLNYNHMTVTWPPHGYWM